MSEYIGSQGYGKDFTADELHERIVAAMLRHSKHFNMGLEDIINKHQSHPLDQIINSCLTRLYLKNDGPNRVD